jgi:hypothetical protein
MPYLSLRRAGLRGGALLLPTMAAGFAAIAMPATPAAAQFAVYPIVVTLSPPVGAETVGSVWVRNEGRESREFRFEIQDFAQDSVGTPRFQPQGALEGTCAGRIEVFPQAATLAPGEGQELRVSLQGAPNACWAALLVEAVPGHSYGIVARQQIGVRINGVPPGSVLEGEITRLEVENRGGPTLHLWFRNTGDAPIRPVGQVELHDTNGTVVATIRVDAFSVLPGLTRILSVPLAQKLPSGRYTAVPVLDFGGEYLAGGQTTFMVR